MQKIQLCDCYRRIDCECFSCSHDFIRENSWKQISSVCRSGSINKNSEFRNRCSSDLRRSEELVEICDIVDRKPVFKGCSKSFSDKLRVRVCRRCRTSSNSHIIRFECWRDCCSWYQCSKFASKDQWNNIVTFPDSHLIQKRSFVVSKQFGNFLLCVLQKPSAPVKKLEVIRFLHFFSKDFRKNFISCFRQFVVCRSVDCLVNFWIHIFLITKLYCFRKACHRRKGSWFGWKIFKKQFTNWNRSNSVVDFQFNFNEIRWSVCREGLSCSIIITNSFCRSNNWSCRESWTACQCCIFFHIDWKATWTSQRGQNLNPSRKSIICGRCRRDSDKVCDSQCLTRSTDCCCQLHRFPCIVSRRSVEFNCCDFCSCFNHWPTCISSAACHESWSCEGSWFSDEIKPFFQVRSCFERCCLVCIADRRCESDCFVLIQNHIDDFRNIDFKFSCLRKKKLKEFNQSEHCRSATDFVCPTVIVPRWFWNALNEKVSIDSARTVSDMNDLTCFQTVLLRCEIRCDYRVCICVKFRFSARPCFSKVTNRAVIDHCTVIDSVTSQKKLHCVNRSLIQDTNTNRFVWIIFKFYIVILWHGWECWISDNFFTKIEQKIKRSRIIKVFNSHCFFCV